MRLGVCVGTKRSNRYLAEWVGNYRSLGFDLIIILDNNEVHGERPSDVLGPAPDIVIIDKRGDHSDARQVIYYTEIYNEYKDRLDYILFCDDDEYLTLNPRFRDAKDWIGSLDAGDADCICVNWRIFGDNGHIRYEDAPIRERFPVPCPYDVLASYPFSHDDHVKTMVHCQGKPIVFQHPHYCKDSRGIPLKSVNASGKPIQPSVPFCEHDFTCASLDHFQTRSTEEFCNRRLGKSTFYNNKHFDGTSVNPLDEIQMYFSYNEYTDEKMEYILDFLRKEKIPLNDIKDIQKVLAISHEANVTGAPIALIGKMKAAPPYRSFTTVLLADGPLRPEFEKLGPVKIPDYKSPLGKRILRRFFPRTYKGVCTDGIPHPLAQRLIRRFFTDMYDSPLQRLAKKGEFDAIYANTIASLDAATDIKKKLRIPLIAHIHEAESVLKSYHASAGQFLACDAVIACCKKVADDLMNLYDVPKDKIVIQYPVSGTMLDFLEAGVPERHGDGTFRAAMAGSGMMRKGFDLIPAVAKKLRMEHPDIPIEFILFSNSGPEERALLEVDLRKAGVADIVTFRDADRYKSEIARCDAFLLLSREDPFPLVAQENALLAHPIILFEGACGTTEWLGPDACITVPYLDTDAVAEAIYDLYKNPDRACAIGMRAREISEAGTREAAEKMKILPTIHQFYSDVR